MLDSKEKEKEQYRIFLKENKGKAFSIDGICTLGRFWKNVLIVYIIGFVIRLPVISTYNYINYRDTVEFHLHPLFYRFLDNCIKTFETESYILIAFFFWLCIYDIVMLIYITFLKVKRLRSVYLNPWLVFIPFFSTIVACFIPCKKDLQNKQDLNSKIKFKKLFISIIIVSSSLLLFVCIYGIYDDFFEKIRQ